MIPDLGAPPRKVPCVVDRAGQRRAETCVLVLQADWQAVLLELCAAAPPEARSETCHAEPAP
jgi:hypothetical protein